MNYWSIMQNSSDSPVTSLIHGRKYFTLKNQAFYVNKGYGK
jgi:hypothetical protein